MNDNENYCKTDFPSQTHIQKLITTYYKGVPQDTVTGTHAYNQRALHKSKQFNQGFLYTMFQVHSHYKGFQVITLPSLC